jgi:hypothetical protein
VLTLISAQVRGYRKKSTASSGQDDPSERNAIIAAQTTDNRAAFFPKATN